MKALTRTMIMKLKRIPKKKTFQKFINAWNKRIEKCITLE